MPITGGEFSGPDIRGKVLPGGADWQLIRDDGVSELEARYTLSTDDGATIHVRNLALRHGPADVMEALTAGQAVGPGSYYFRGTTFFETTDTRYGVDHQVHCRLQRRTRARRRQTPILQGAVI